MNELEIVIVGGGVVGLSCAYELAARGRRVALLERHARFGEETSTHNSGVLHAGIYYEAGSLKTRLCVAGRRMLVERLRAWGVAHRLGGKLIVATEPAEAPALEALWRKGRANGVDDLDFVAPAAALAREPNIRVVAALLSPGTGVFDVGHYLQQLAGRAQEQGALLLPQAAVVGVERRPTELVVATRARGEVRCAAVINAAGLYADEVAGLCGDGRQAIHPCRGEYAAVIPRRAGLINNLVYPVPPDELSLGVHLTRTVDGELWLGPDAKYIAAKDDYEGARRPVAEFLPSAQKLCPALRAEDLRPGQAGIRPKRNGPGEPARDFLIEQQADDPRLVHLVGIESPGLTASPAIATLAADTVERSGVL